MRQSLLVVIAAVAFIAGAVLLFNHQPQSSVASYPVGVLAATIGDIFRHY